MNREKKITFIICFSIYALIILLIMGQQQGYDKWSNVGTAGFFLGIAYFLISLLLLVAKKTRQVGAALLISAGIIFLIGLSVCSQYPIRF